MPHHLPLPARDLTWHRTQAALLDQRGAQHAITQRLRRSDYRAAMVYLTRLQAIAPTPETACQLAEMHMRCRAYQAGLAHVQQARDCWPQDMALLRLQAELAMLAGDFPQAEPLWRQVIARQNAHGPYPVLRALACLRQTGQHRAAEGFIEQHAGLLRKHMARAGAQMLRNGRFGRPDLPRGLYLVSGNNGTGKSTLGHLLHAMGYPIIDADTEIASFCLNRRFSDVRHDLQRLSPDANSRIHWAWPDCRVTERFARARQRREAVFVIGGFGKTILPYLDRFRRVFHLTAPDQVIAARLAARGSVGHKVGSKGYDAALRRNAREQDPGFPATVLSADRPAWAICAELLSTFDKTSGAQPRMLERIGQ